VRFPGFERRLAIPYHSISSARLHEAVSGRLGDAARLRCGIAALRADGVTLASGEAIAASVVIDGRGFAPVRSFDLRWQKFLGLELDLAGPHGLDAPLLMDATVAQRDGYRFVYVLPFGPCRLLVEDTRYSDTPELHVEELRTEIRAYAARRGWMVTGVAREETGVLPIVLGGDVQGFWCDSASVPRSGMAAMLCHHTTGYSLPDAVRLADLIAAIPDLSGATVAAVVREFALRRWHEQRFFRLLNRLMFEAAAPAERHRTLQHFYRLSEPLIARFYAGELSVGDRLRILTGKPPVPVVRALRCLARGLWPSQEARAAVARGKGA
jgi:lycopene beta-cyclase